MNARHIFWMMVNVSKSVAQKDVVVPLSEW